MTTTQTADRDIADGTSREFTIGTVTVTAYWSTALRTWVTIPEDDE